MAHLFQVGVGSGGIVVLDLLARDARIYKVTIVDPDDYQPHNVERHLFASQGVGRLKVDLAVDWLRERCPELAVQALAVDLTSPEAQPELERHLENVDLAVCAADNELAKHHFDKLMRPRKIPWTLGEVLSGGIGGWVHRFVPDGPCYGCVSSHLQRSAPSDPAAPLPDYSQPAAAIEQARIPASRASIQAIASLHALLTLELLDRQPTEGEFTSLLMPLQRVDGVFTEAYRPFRFPVPRSLGCLICATGLAEPGEDLDAALDQALARLGDV